MTDPILCPYCGAEMKLDGQYVWTRGIGAECIARWYLCPECGARSPRIDGDDSRGDVDAAARMRYDPQTNAERAAAG